VIAGAAPRFLPGPGGAPPPARSISEAIAAWPVSDDLLALLAEGRKANVKPSRCSCWTIAIQPQQSLLASNKYRRTANAPSDAVGLIKGNIKIGQRWAT
jgi:hypothetical protein